MYPNPSGRKRIACSAFYEVVQNRYTPSSANFKESLTAGLPLKKPETLSNCVGPLLLSECRTICFRHLGPRVRCGGHRSDRQRTPQDACVSGVCHPHKLNAMRRINLRTRPFCASTHLTVAMLRHEQTQFVVVTCSGCGAMGPPTSPIPRDMPSCYGISGSAWY